MKIKHLFITLGLSLAVGLGVGAGLSASRDVKEAKAYDTKTIYFDLGSAFAWWKAKENPHYYIYHRVWPSAGCSRARREEDI